MQKIIKSKRVLNKFRFSSELEKTDLPNDQKEIIPIIKRGKFRSQYNLKEGEIINNFKVQNIQHFKDFNLTTFELEHTKTFSKYLVRKKFLSIFSHKVLSF